jgi:hypothetical protein
MPLAVSPQRGRSGAAPRRRPFPSPAQVPRRIGGPGAVAILGHRRAATRRTAGPGPTRASVTASRRARGPRSACSGPRRADGAGGDLRHGGSPMVEGQPDLRSSASVSAGRASRPGPPLLPPRTSGSATGRARHRPALDDRHGPEQADAISVGGMAQVSYLGSVGGRGGGGGPRRVGRACAGRGRPPRRVWSPRKTGCPPGPGLQSEACLDAPARGNLSRPGRCRSDPSQGRDLGPSGLTRGGAAPPPGCGWWSHRRSRLRP